MSRHAGKSCEFSNVCEFCPCRSDRADSVFCLSIPPGQFVSAINCPQGTARLLGSCPELHPVSVHDSVFHLLDCPFRGVRPELRTEAETEDKLAAAVSRSEFQRRSVSSNWRNSSSNENRSRQQSPMADDSREGTVYGHRHLRRYRHGKDKLLYAAIRRAIDRI